PPSRNPSPTAGLTPPPPPAPPGSISPQPAAAATARRTTAKAAPPRPKPPRKPTVHHLTTTQVREDFAPTVCRAALPRYLRTPGPAGLNGAPPGMSGDSVQASRHVRFPAWTGHVCPRRRAACPACCPSLIAQMPFSVEVRVRGARTSVPGADAPGCRARAAAHRGPVHNGSPGAAARGGDRRRPDPALPGELFLRAHDTELVSLRVGQNGPGLSAGLPDVDLACPERKQ